jgi:hypothetical protein
MLNETYFTPRGLKPWFGETPRGGDYKVFAIGSPYTIPIGVQEGDFGLFMPSAPVGLPDKAPIVYRYKQFVQVLPTGDDIGMWLPPHVYAGTPEIWAYATGVEDQSSLITQGFTITEIGNSLITTAAGGYIRVQADPGVVFSQAFLTLPTIAGSNRFYLRCDLKNNYSGAGGSGFSQVGIVQSNTEVNTQYAFGRLLATTNWRPYRWDEGTSTWVEPTGNLALTMREGGNVNVPFPSSQPAGTFWSYEVTGQSINNLVETVANGLPIVSVRRNVDSAVAGDPLTLQVFAQGRSSGTIPSQVDVRQLYFLTW